MRSLRNSTLNFALYALLGIGAIIVFIPYVWMFSSSLKEQSEVFQRTLNFIPSNPNFDAYGRAMHITPLGRCLLNSIIMATGETLCVVTTSVLAGYAFSRLRFPGRDALFMLVLGAMMIPGIVTMIPAFIEINWFGWVNTYQGLIVPRAVMAFGIFLMRQFFMSIPYELEDAARIDGCSRLRVLVQIMLPLSGPALATLAIFAFTNSWNEFFWPLITTTRSEATTVQVALATMKGGSGGESLDWPALMAGATMSVLPTLVVYLALQRYFTKGIVMSGIKG